MNTEVNSLTTTKRRMHYWARTLRGLEWLARAELEMLPGIEVKSVSERNIFFSTENDVDLQHIRCVDDIYIYAGQLNNIGHTKDDLKEFPSLMCDVDLPNNTNSINHFRVTASAVGKRNYSRFDIENEIGELICKKTKMKYVPSEVKLHQDVVWYRLHIDNEVGYFGYRVKQQPLHRRTWRIENQKGSLHPPLAASMVMLADLETAQSVIDPFCGSGTLLIEAGLKFPHLRLIGSDFSNESVRRSNINANLAKVKSDFSQNDASKYNHIDVDRIITNPPWENVVNLSGDLNVNSFEEIFSRIVSEARRAVFLFSQSQEIPKRMMSEKQDLLTQNVRVSGKLAKIVVISSDEIFPNTFSGNILKREHARRLIL